MFAPCSICSLQFRHRYFCKTAITANCTDCIYKCKAMTEYRFTLQKYKRGSKLTCPKCGRKQCFVKYIDTEGQIIFPDYVGRCDHEHSCQYHYKPSDYFKDNPIILEERKPWKPKGSRGNHRQKLYNQNPQTTLTATSCAVHLPTMKRIPYSLSLRGCLAKKKPLGCSNYTMSGHPRNGEVPQCSGRLTDKEECGLEKLCCIIR